MTPTDYVLLGILLVSAIVGLFRGLLREAISVVTWIVALWAAWQYGPSLEPSLGGALAEPGVRPWAARAIIFIGVLLAGAVVGWVISYFVQLSIFSGLDRLLGLFFGLLRGFVVIGALVMLGQAVDLHHEPWWRGAKLMPTAEGSADLIRAFVGDEPFERARELLSSAR